MFVETVTPTVYITFAFLLSPMSRNGGNAKIAAKEIS